MNNFNSEQLFEICQNVPDAVCIIDTDWNIQVWNRAAEDVFGYPADEIIGQSITVIIPEDIARKEIEHCTSELNAKGKMPPYQSVRVAKDRRILQVEMIAVALKKDAAIAGYAAIMRDITERRRLEHQLVESEASLRTIFNSSNDAIFVHEIESGRILEVNKKFYEMYGGTLEEVPGLEVEAISAGTPGYRNEDALQRIKKAAEGEPQSFEWMAKNKTGKLFWVEVNLRRIGLQGRDRILATVRDITERKQAEQQLRARETQLSMIYDAVYDIIFVIGAEPFDRFRFISVNRRFLEATGLPESRVVGRLVNEVIPEPSYSLALGKYKEAVQSGQSVHWEEVTAYPSGEKVGEVSVTPVFDAQGACTQLIGTVHDVTERKRAEDALRLSESRFRNLFKQSSLSMQILAPDGLTIEVNHAWQELWGLKCDAAKDYNILHDKQLIRKGIMPYIQKGFAGEATEIPPILYDPSETVLSGRPRWVKAFIYPVKAADGRVCEVVLMHVDVTETVKAEQALRKSEEALKHSYAGLEVKVRERTRELARTNQELNIEIAERRRAVELIKRSHELSDALNDLNTVIHSTLDFEEIMKRVVKEAALAIKVDGSAIGLMQDMTFQIRYVHNMAVHLSGWSVPLDQLTGVSAAATIGQPVAFNDAEHDQRLNLELVRKWGFRSMLVAPLIIKRRMAGAIVFYSFSSPVVFQQEHIDFARKLAASVSLALENAALYRAIEESRRLAESRLVELRTIYETAPVGLCFIDRDMRYVSINRKLAEINEVPVEETIGRTLGEIIADAPAARIIEALINRAVTTGRPVENIEITRKKDLIVLANYYPIKDQAGAVVGVNVVVQDITERKRADDAVRRSERLLKALLNSVPDMAWLKDNEGRFILVNEPFARTAGRNPDELAGKTDFDAWPPDLAGRYRADDNEVMKSRLPKRVEEPLACPEGEPLWIETIKTPIYNEEGTVIGTAGIARDTTARKRMEEEIRHMALHDSLTGLPNRRMFLDILNLEVAQARRHERKLAVLFLDLDRFKEINDTLGHDVGDRLLKHVAGRFRSTVRESDTVARIGGDEFNIVLADITRPDDVSDIALKIVNSLARPVLLKGHELHVTTSIGISIYPDDSEEIETLLRFADIAMYHAKANGRNTYRFYNSSINVRSLERMKLENYLRQTVKRDELSVLYQPMIDIKSKKICYAEALVRWNHPDRGVLAPKEFIPLAEETGFITQIDEWVLRTVCAQTAAWKKVGFSGFCVTVNLSARQFQSPGLVPMIAAVLGETRMPPDCLDLEVTESVAMSDVERSAAQLRELRDMGIHISIDDFGTGYSSLNYLKKLPIERLKIDKSFIQDIAKDPDDRAIISAVTSMARKMGIRTVAEGVETEEQLEFLRSSDCDEAQGFLFSTPVPAKKFRELVTTGAKSW